MKRKVHDQAAAAVLPADPAAEILPPETTGGPAYLGAEFDRWLSQIYLPRRSEG